MAYRPYPNVDRARHQLARHYPEPPAEVEAPECLRPVAASLAQLRAHTRQAAGQGFGGGGYVLSTRRLGVVSGGS
jgi:hypothetical protein